MTTGRVCARATGSTRCTHRACVRGERGERTGGSLSTGAKYSLSHRREATRLSRRGFCSRSQIQARVDLSLSLSLGEFSAGAHRRSVFRRVEEWSWATRCATGTPLCWEIRRMGTSMTSRRSVPAGEVFDVSVLTARRRVERGLGKGDAGECPVLMLEGEGGCIEDA